MEIIFVPVESIQIKNRSRQQFGDEALGKLQQSLSDPEVGLLHPIRLSKDLQLIVGERRLKALKALHFLGTPVKFNGEPIPADTIPAIVCDSAQAEIEMLKQELDENIARENFTYLEETQLTAKIARLQEAIRRTEVARAATPENPTEIIPDLIPLTAISSEAKTAAAVQLFPDQTEKKAREKTVSQLEVASILETAPESQVAKQLSKAQSHAEAQKILDNYKKEEVRTALAAQQGRNFSSKLHRIIHGDCLLELPKLQPASFDVVCCDPIYGIDAHKFGDAAGKMASKRHDYDDSYENWQRIMPEALKLVSKLLKKEAHMYLACDFDRFHELKRFVLDSNLPDNPWKIQRSPIVQYKTEGGRVPHPGFTCRRASEFWLFAYRGGKQEYNMINDVIPCSSDRSETHGAGKPIGLLTTFLRRSCMPGNQVLDFMAGSGGILVAGHQLNLRVTAIEICQADYGRCLERLKEIESGKV